MPSASLALALVVGLVVAPTASEGLVGYSCTDSVCANCTEIKTNPNATIVGNCSSLNGHSAKSFCAHGNATFESFNNNDCSGSPTTTVSFAANQCISSGSSSFKLLCERPIVPTFPPVKWPYNLTQFFCEDASCQNCSKFVPRNTTQYTVNGNCVSWYDPQKTRRGSTKIQCHHNGSITMSGYKHANCEEKHLPTRVLTFSDKCETIGTEHVVMLCDPSAPLETIAVDTTVEYPKTDESTTNPLAASSNSAESTTTSPSTMAEPSTVEPMVTPDLTQQESFPTLPEPRIPTNDNGLIVTQGLVIKASTLADKKSPVEDRTIRIKIKDGGQWNLNYCYDMRIQLQSSAGIISETEGMIFYLPEMIYDSSIACDSLTMKMLLYSVPNLYLRGDEVIRISFAGNWSVGSKPTNPFFEVLFVADQTAPSTLPMISTTIPSTPTPTPIPTPTPASPLTADPTQQTWKVVLSVTFGGSQKIYKHIEVNNNGPLSDALKRDLMNAVTSRFQQGTTEDVEVTILAMWVGSLHVNFSLTSRLDASEASRVISGEQESDHVASTKFSNTFALYQQGAAATGLPSEPFTMDNVIVISEEEPAATQTQNKSGTDDTASEEQALSDGALALSILGGVFIIVLAVVVSLKVRKFREAKKHDGPDDTPAAPALTEELLHAPHTQSHDAPNVFQVASYRTHDQHGRSQKQLGGEANICSAGGGGGGGGVSPNDPFTAAMDNPLHLNDANKNNKHGCKQEDVAPQQQQQKQQF